MRTDRLQSVFWFLVVVFAILFLWHDLARGLAPFDHANCQYPERASNPPDGCDNSDPARPECMKLGVEDCSIPSKEVQSPAPVEKTAPAPSQPVVSEPEPVILPPEPLFVGK